MQQDVQKMDSILAEVVAKYLLGVTDEMSAALMRTAFSPNIKERGDCSTAVFDRHGNVIALPQRVPIHLGSMVGVIDEILKRYSRESLREGDMFLANDPYHGGGSHLPDINLVSPVFHEGEVVAFVANIAHHSDVGGMVPGSEAAVCSSIFQEGLRLPPVRVASAGVINQDVLDIILLNSRTPQERQGDLKAQIAANTVGIRSVQDLYRRYGTERLSATIASYLDFTERRFSAAISALPDGQYVARERMDDDLTGAQPELRLRLTVGRGKLHFDFEGTSPQLASARNIPYRALIATIYTVVKSLLDHEIAANAGYFRTITVAAPPRSVVGPESPAPVGARSLSCAVLGDLIVQAMNQAMPDRGMAGSGPHHLIVLAGEDPRNGSYFVNYETIAGAMGARAHRPGMDAVRVHASGASNLPVEALEHAYPLRVEQYAIRAGSGGEGRRRGGCGVIRDYRVLANNAVLSLSTERQQFPARGVNGAGDGLPGEIWLDPETPQQRKLPSTAADIPVAYGQVLRVCTPGGGGHDGMED